MTRSEPLPDCPDFWEFIHTDGHRKEIGIVERLHIATGERAHSFVAEFPDKDLEEMRQVRRFTRLLIPPPYSIPGT